MASYYPVSAMLIDHDTLAWLSAGWSAGAELNYENTCKIGRMLIDSMILE